MDFSNIVSPKLIAAAYNTAASNKIPYFGESLFTPAKTAGLDLAWIKGSSGITVSLAPSAFDAKATFRTIEGIKRIETEMPFFREGFHISERDRLELLRAKNEDDPYVDAVLNRVYDYVGNLIDAANVVAERMRMALLFPTGGDMKIIFKANGVDYSYNYDAAGTWKANNYATLTSTALWSAPTTANPIKDFSDMASKAADVSGSEVKYAIMSSDTFTKMLATDAVKDLYVSTSGRNISFITPAMGAQAIASVTGITPIVYKKKYKTESGVATAYVPDGYVTFIPEGALGNTWYGTTPEEANIIFNPTATATSDVSIVNTGIAVTKIFNPHPADSDIIVSEIVLPSFERMDEVVTLKVTA